MVIDHFIEKIVEDGDRKIIGLKISAKDFLSRVNALADEYCSNLNISRSDFGTGKELFNTLNYYLKSDYKDILFRFLSEKDREIVYNYYSESVAIISEQENKYPDFDAIVICEALVNILHLYGSLKCDNIDIFTSSFEDHKKGSISSENAAHSECRIGILDFDEKIDMHKLIESYRIYDGIDILVQESEIFLNRYYIGAGIVDIAKKKGAKKGAKIARAVLFGLDPVAGLVEYGLLSLVGIKCAKDYNKVRDYYERINRFNYWRYILYAVFNYYRKNMEV